MVAAIHIFMRSAMLVLHPRWPEASLIHSMAGPVLTTDSGEQDSIPCPGPQGKCRRNALPFLSKGYKGHPILREICSHLVETPPQSAL